MGQGGAWRPGAGVSSNFKKLWDPGKTQCVGASVFPSVKQSLT